LPAAEVVGSALLDHPLVRHRRDVPYGDRGRETVQIDRKTIQMPKKFITM